MDRLSFFAMALPFSIIGIFIVGFFGDLWPLLLGGVVGFLIASVMSILKTLKRLEEKLDQMKERKV